MIDCRPADLNAIIATATNTVVASVDVGGGQHSIAFTPNGSFAYVVNEFPAVVSVIVTPIQLNGNRATLDFSVSGLSAPQRLPDVRHWQLSRRLRQPARF